MQSRETVNLAALASSESEEAWRVGTLNLRVVPRLLSARSFVASRNGLFPMSLELDSNHIYALSLPAGMVELFKYASDRFPFVGQGSE